MSYHSLNIGVLNSPVRKHVAFYLPKQKPSRAKETTPTKPCPELLSMMTVRASAMSSSRALYRYPARTNRQLFRKKAKFLLIRRSKNGREKQGAGRGKLKNCYAMSCHKRSLRRPFLFDKQHNERHTWHWRRVLGLCNFSAGPIQTPSPLHLPLNTTSPSFTSGRRVPPRR